MTVAVDPMQEARKMLDERAREITSLARDLGHDLHPFAPTPDGALAKRTTCRKCGRRARVQVIPRGTFTQPEMRETGWVTLSVRCGT